MTTTVRLFEKSTLRQGVGPIHYIGVQTNGNLLCMWQSIIAVNHVMKLLLLVAWCLIFCAYKNDVDSEIQSSS